MLPREGCKAAGCLCILTFLACCNPMADKAFLAMGDAGSSTISGCCIDLKGCFVPCREHVLACHSNTFTAHFAHRGDPALSVKGSPAV